MTHGISRFPIIIDGPYVNPCPHDYESGQYNDKGARPSATGYACQHNRCYAAGYAAGKEKAHFETRMVPFDNHAHDCGCEPCITVRAVLRGLWEAMVIELDKKR